MFNIEKFSLNLSFNGFFLILAVLIIAAYSFYNYRYTVPAVNPSKRLFLVLLRALALTLVVLIIFEPIVSLAHKNVIEPVTLIFTDNSRSIKINDGTNREENLRSILNESIGSINGVNELYSFGNKVIPFTKDSAGKLSFEEGSTNFSSIINAVNKNQGNISSILIISDGVITEGTNPVFSAEKLNIPVFTIGIGDSTSRKDIEIRNLLFNQYIYAGTPTSIVASVFNNGFAGKNTNVSLYENDRLVEQTTVTLSTDGIQNVNFSYTPKDGGEKKITVSASSLQGEFTNANNKKVFYVNVLSNKIKVALLSGAPSPDQVFIRDILAEDPNIDIRSVTFIGQNKILEKIQPEQMIDSADIFFLVGFPSRETSEGLLNKVVKQITQQNKPFFFLLTDIVDLNRMKSLSAELPFVISRPMPGFTDVQPNIRVEESKNPMLQNNAQNPLEMWNNLPPVQQMNSEITARAESNILAGVKINNIPINKPLIISRRLGSKRSVAITAKDIWKWKLQMSNKNTNLFDQFVMGSLKWLNTSEAQKQVSVRTSKKVYALGERVEFAGQVYDEAFNPVSDAEVKVTVSGAEKSEVLLNSLGNGLYEGVFETNNPGDYAFTGTASSDNRKIGSDNGRFNIGEVDLEMAEPRMNYEFLSSLSNRTGGKFFMYTNYRPVFNEINNINKQASKEKITSSEFELWSSEWLLSLAVLIFAIEWFIRKRSGML